jgi:eukaryotic-like serine/threonine-protein kinase
MATTTSLPKINGLREHDLVRLLGEGGMGKAFLARHKRSGESVVVKTIHEHLLGEAKTRQRFQQEIDLMRRFRHPNAVAFLHASPPQVEPPFLIMEYVRGITLDALMQEHGRLPPLRVGRLLAPLCLFLQAAHDNGLLHRDLTPANIMIAEPDTPQETIKVMDFGLARRIGFYIPSGQLDSASSAIDGGTPDYICPEQIQGKQVDHRGDLFSVGVLLYGLLTGHVPCEHLTDPNQILWANIHQAPPPFSHWKIADVPSTIERLVLSCLAKSPADRPDSAQTLIETFQLALGAKLLDEDAFAASLEKSHSSLQELERFDPRTVIDQFDASMVEQMAAMKLRGFVDGVGGRVEQSDAGVIKVSLPRVTEGVPKKVLMGWFQVRTEEIDWIALELHMAKKQIDTRSLVEITVTRPHAADDTIERAQARKSYCDGICCELRAYLMAGR